MAMNIRDLSVHTYSNDHTLWCYRAKDDAFDAVTTAGYFNDASDMVARGDAIIIQASDGYGIRFVGERDAADVILVPGR